MLETVHKLFVPKLWRVSSYLHMFERWTAPRPLTPPIVNTTLACKVMIVKLESCSESWVCAHSICSNAYHTVAFSEEFWSLLKYTNNVVYNIYDHTDMYNAWFYLTTLLFCIDFVAKYVWIFSMALYSLLWEHMAQCVFLAITLSPGVS